MCRSPVLEPANPHSQACRGWVPAAENCFFGASPLDGLHSSPKRPHLYCPPGLVGVASLHGLGGRLSCSLRPLHRQCMTRSRPATICSTGHEPREPARSRIWLSSSQASLLALCTPRGSLARLSPSSVSHYPCNASKGPAALAPRIPRNHRSCLRPRLSRESSTRSCLC
jgi:hypothetical protein